MGIYKQAGRRMSLFVAAALAIIMIGCGDGRQVPPRHRPAVAVGHYSDIKLLFNGTPVVNGSAFDMNTDIKVQLQFRRLVPIPDIDEESPGTESDASLYVDVLGKSGRLERILDDEAIIVEYQRLEFVEHRGDLCVFEGTIQVGHIGRFLVLVTERLDDTPVLLATEVQFGL